MRPINPRDHSINYRSNLQIQQNRIPIKNKMKMVHQRYKIISLMPPCGLFARCRTNNWLFLVQRPNIRINNAYIMNSLLTLTQSTIGMRARSAQIKCNNSVKKRSSSPLWVNCSTRRLLPSKGSNA